MGASLAGRHWLTALKFSTIGNLIYYVCLASAIQRTGAPISTMIIGTLPVVIPMLTKPQKTKVSEVAVALDKYQAT